MELGEQLVGTCGRCYTVKANYQGLIMTVSWGEFTVLRVIV